LSFVVFVHHGFLVVVANLGLNSLGGSFMEVTVQHLGALQFEIKARQHVVLSDQPPENGGHDEGMTPPELLLASLGSCAGFYAAQYLRKHKLATEGTRVRVTADKLKDPARMDNFHIAIEAPAALTEPHRAGVENAVHHCLIHNTLLHPPGIAIEIGQAVPEALGAGD
jgi:putative redox protein